MTTPEFTVLDIILSELKETKKEISILSTQVASLRLSLKEIEQSLRKVTTTDHSELLSHISGLTQTGTGI